MGTRETSSVTMPFESMVIEKRNKPAIPLRRTLSDQECCGTVYMPPRHFYMNAAPPETSQSNLWGNQYPMMQHYMRTPVQYPTPYHQNEFFPHPNLIPGLASTKSEAEGKMGHWKEWDGNRNCNGSSENFEFIGDRLRANNRTAQGSEYQLAIQSGHEDLVGKNEDKAHHNEYSAMKKRSYNMLAEGSDTQNDGASPSIGTNHQVSDLGNHLVSMPESNPYMRIPKASSSRSKSTVVRNTAAGVSEPSTHTSECKEVMNDQLIQDELELRKEGKRVVHIEAAKKYRIHIQPSCESLKAKEKELSSETSKLSASIACYSKKCLKLSKANKGLLDQLRQMYGPDEMARLEAENPDPNPDPSPNPDQSESENDYSSSDDISTSIHDVEADSE